MRERLTHANGSAGNQIMWIGAPPLAPDPESTDQAFLLLDRWLGAVETDRSDGSIAEKVVRDRPAQAVDACWIAGRKVTDGGTCRAAFPHFGDPRIAAGGSMANDVLKCRREPLDRADYAVDFTDDQWARLQKVFATGVCNYRQPGIAQGPSVPWLTYESGPGGRPLAAAPRSVALRGAHR